MARYSDVPGFFICLASRAGRRTRESFTRDGSVTADDDTHQAEENCLRGGTQFDVAHRRRVPATAARRLDAAGVQGVGDGGQ